VNALSSTSARGRFLWGANSLDEMRVDTPEFETWLRLAREPLTAS